MSTNEIDSGIEKLGAYGTAGVPWSHYDRIDIKEIHVCHRNTGVISAVKFVYLGEDGGDVVIRHGTEYPMFNQDRIVLDPDEHITRVYGSYSVDENNMLDCLLSFGIETNRESYGPFGGVNPNRNSQNFSYAAPWQLFKGFHGTVDDGILTGIGVFVKPTLNNITEIRVIPPHQPSPDTLPPR